MPELSKERSVCCIETGEVFSSIADAARAKGCTAANISKAMRKRGVAAGGHWRPVVPDYMNEMTVRKARGLVCLACCDRGPMAIGGGGIPAPDGTTYIGLGSNNTELLTAENNSDTVFEPGGTYEFKDLYTMVKGYKDYVFDVTSYPDGTTDTSADVMYTAYFASR